MSDNAFKLHSTTDAVTWAEEFCKTISTHEIEIDVDFMLGWFANAIMCGYDHAKNEGK